MNGGSHPLFSNIFARWPAIALCSCSFIMAAFAAAPNLATSDGWAVVDSPNSSPQDDNLLSGVTCVSSDDCWAVGSYHPPSHNPGGGLIMHWNGSAWSVVQSPSAGLTDVTCISHSDCWAVGGSTIEKWDGSSWATVPWPNGSSDAAGLADVACTSASNCWVVGIQSGKTRTLRWNGVAWSVVDSPNVGTSYNSLEGIACSSESQCWAVGSYYTGSTYLTLIEHWDGISWSVVTSPNDSSSSSNGFNDVACTSDTDCWAAGATFRTLFAHWDGISWQIVPSPNRSGTVNYVQSISCLTSSQCWAVGYFGYSGARRSLLMQWDGTSWTLATAPNVSGQENQLYDISCRAGGTECWAVFYRKNATARLQTLTERYVAPANPIQIVSVASQKPVADAQTYDVDIGNGKIECRSGAAEGNYALAFTFAAPLTNVDGAIMESGQGAVVSAAIGDDPHQYIVQLAGIVNPQTIIVSLTNVNDSQGNHNSTVRTLMPVLIGDVNGDGFVNSADVAQIKGQSGLPVTNINFRQDLNGDGLINSADISLAKSKSGTALP